MLTERERERAGERGGGGERESVCVCVYVCACVCEREREGGREREDAYVCISSRVSNARDQPFSVKVAVPSVFWASKTTGQV